MYQNYSRQKYGYGEPQMTKREAKQCNFRLIGEQSNRTDKVLGLLWAVVMTALTVAVVVGLEMRGFWR
jgi:hypothetical protein